MPITSEDTLATVLAGTQVHRPVHKVFTPAASALTALWGLPGVPGDPGLPANGANGTIRTSASAGALPFSNPAGGTKTYLTQMAMTCTTHGAILLYDRLWDNQFANATTTTAQAITQPALTRSTDGKGVECWLTAWAALGAGTGGTITITYTDQDGTAGNTGSLQLFAASGLQGRTWQFALAAGDTGIRSVQSFQATATMTSGTIGLVLRKRLAMIQVSPGGVAGILDALDAALLAIPDNACLELVWMGLNGTAALLYGDLNLAQG